MLSKFAKKKTGIYFVVARFINYLQKGSFVFAGAAINWLKDNLGLLKDATESGMTQTLVSV